MMKKLIFLLFSMVLLVSQVSAKEYTKEEEEAMIKQFTQYQKDIDKSNQELAEAKAETESARKVNQKLDEILGVLEKEKK
jgi:uncharacterized protein YcfL